MASTVGLRYSSGRGRWVIAATILGSGMATLDATVVAIALPTIGRDFHAGVAALQWVTNGYTLALAGLLLLGGALGDRYGRRRVFIIGSIWLAAASLLCGIAPNTPALIAARMLQGVGGALLTPGSLAILQASFVERDRSRAIGAWSGFAGIATAIGPFVGGWLISAASWQLVFLINVPVAAVVVALALRFIPESRDPTVSGRLDLPGAALVSLGLAGVVYGLTDGPQAGWGSPAVLASLLGGAAALVAFLVVERFAQGPMMPLGLFRSAQFSGANAVTFLLYGGFGGAMFLVPIELQQVTRYSPIASGAALLPITAITLALSARAGELASRIGPRLQMSVGPLLVAVGVALLARVGAGTGYVATVLPAVCVLGLGLAIAVAPLTATVLAAAPSMHSGVASAINSDVARTGTLIAVAVLPALSGITGDSYLHPDRFSTGFHMAAMISAAACAAAGLLAVATIRNPPRRREEPAERVRFSCPLEAPPLAAPSR